MTERYGSWALVAGASEGLGEAHARALAAHGFNLVLASRRESVLNEVAAKIKSQWPVEVRVVAVDLAVPGFIDELDAASADVDLGLVIYNAAHAPIGEFLSLSADDVAKVVDVNCRGPVVLAHFFGRKFKQRGRGGIILMGSLAGFQGSATIATYAASKAFNLVLAEGLWAEFRQHGVDVLACVAGATDTPGFRKAKVRVPFIMKPEAVAEAALSALGHTPTIITGGFNKLVQFLMNRLFPRRLAVMIMANAGEKLARALEGNGAALPPRDSRSHSRHVG